MTFDHYVKFVDQGIEMIGNPDNYRERTALAGMGLAGEAGEVCDHAKKTTFHGKEMDKRALIHEMGDVLWYFALMLHTNDITFDEVMETNVYKLCDRYPERHGDPEDILAGRAV